MKIYLILFLTSILIVINNVVSQHPSSFQSAEDADHHLHQNQIPPPHAQPSREDVAKLLSEIFTTQIDKDSDGFISAVELKNWIEKVHKKLIDDDIAQQWAYYQPETQEVHSWEGYNPEKKEVLHWDLYVNKTYPDNIHESGDSDPNFKNLKVLYKRAERRWKLADKNGDSVLVIEEYKDFVHPEESERTRDVLVDEAMEDMDKNANNEISLEEYMNHMTEVSSEEEKRDPNFSQVQQNHFTTFLDKNKDGVLVKEELREWLIPNYDRHEAESWRFISLGDQNRDEKLSIDEFLKNQDQYLSLIPPEFWHRFSDMGTTTPTPRDEF